MSLEMEKKKKFQNEKHGKEKIKKCVHHSEKFHITRTRSSTLPIAINFPLKYKETMNLKRITILVNSIKS